MRTPNPQVGDPRSRPSLFLLVVRDPSPQFSGRLPSAPISTCTRLRGVHNLSPSTLLQNSVCPPWRPAGGAVTVSASAKARVSIPSSRGRCCTPPKHWPQRSRRSPPPPSCQSCSSYLTTEDTEGLALGDPSRVFSRCSSTAPTSARWTCPRRPAPSASLQPMCPHCRSCGQAWLWSTLRMAPPPNTSVSRVAHTE